MAKRAGKPRRPSAAPFLDDEAASDADVSAGDDDDQYANDEPEDDAIGAELLSLGDRLEGLILRGAARADEAAVDDEQSAGSSSESSDDDQEAAVSEDGDMVSSGSSSDGFAECTPENVPWLLPVGSRGRLHLRQDDAIAGMPVAMCRHRPFSGGGEVGDGLDSANATGRPWHRACLLMLPPHRVEEVAQL